MCRSRKPDNRLLRAGNNTFTHDDSGFRSIWSSGSTYSMYKYAPDYRLLKMEVENQNRVYTYRHDEDGQRAAKYLNGQLVEAYQWLDFVRMGAFHDGESAYEFTYEDGARTPYAMKRDDGAIAYIFYDQVGSLRVVADSSGEVIKEVLYDPFGGIIEDTNPDFRVPIGFAGGLHDRDLGFVRFGWRDYDTFTGRWTAPDPIGDRGGDPDWYGYCLDDPVNGVDALGLYADFDSENNDAQSVAESQSDNQAAENGVNGGYGGGRSSESSRAGDSNSPINTGGYQDNDAVNANDPVNAREVAARQADQEAQDWREQRERQQVQAAQDDDKRRRALAAKKKEEKPWYDPIFTYSKILAPDGDPRKEYARQAITENGKGVAQLEHVARSWDAVGTFATAKKRQKQHQDDLSPNNPYNQKKAGADRAPNKKPGEVSYWGSYFEEVKDAFNPVKKY